jgi:hypothetical protein
VGRCANCDAELTGPFCAACGQKDVDLSRSVWALLTEALSEALDVDGRIGRTLPAFLLRPGALTAGFLAGRRRSQVSPVRLFVTSLAVSFLVFWFAGDLAMSRMPEDIGGRLVSYDNGELLIDLSPADSGNNAGIHIAADRDDPWWGPAITSLEGRETGEALGMLLNASYDAAPTVLTLLIPIYALLLEVVARRRPLVHHLVFSVHLHSLMLWTYASAALLQNLLAWATSWSAARAIWTAAVLYIQWHTLAGLRKVYTLTWLGATWRWLVIGFVHSVLLVLAMLAVLALAVRGV